MVVKRICTCPRPCQIVSHDIWFVFLLPANQILKLVAPADAWRTRISSRFSSEPRRSPSSSDWKRWRSCTAAHQLAGTPWPLCKSMPPLLLVCFYFILKNIQNVCSGNRNGRAVVKRNDPESTRLCFPFFNFLRVKPDNSLLLTSSRTLLPAATVENRGLRFHFILVGYSIKITGNNKGACACFGPSS